MTGAAAPIAEKDGPKPEAPAAAPVAGERSWTTSHAAAAARPDLPLDPRRAMALQRAAGNAAVKG
jgi:hypothetical protein